MGIYKLPLGIRIPRQDEYTEGYDVEEINKKRNSANIIQGFNLSEVQGEKFTHIAEINIDADKIWSLFIELTKELINDTAYGIIGFKDEKPTLSNFTIRDKIIESFEEYKFELTNDGFIQFGIAHYDDISLNEIFVTNYKYLQVWTTNKEKLLKVLKEFKLFEYEDLGFIDEFPVVSEAIFNIDECEARHYSDVLDEIEKKFEKF